MYSTCKPIPLFPSSQWRKIRPSLPSGGWSFGGRSVSSWLACCRPRSSRILAARGLPRRGAVRWLAPGGAHRGKTGRPAVRTARRATSSNDQVGRQRLLFRVPIRRLESVERRRGILTVLPSRSEWKRHASLQPVIRDRLSARPQPAPPALVLPWMIQADGGPRAGRRPREHPGYRFFTSDEWSVTAQNVNVSGPSNAPDAGKALGCGRVQVDRIGTRDRCRRGRKGPKTGLHQRRRDVRLTV